MAKLYFKFGAMGSSKTAQALMTKFNYEEKGKSVWIIKPSIDFRDDVCDKNGNRVAMIKSRIGLSSPAEAISPISNIFNQFELVVSTRNIDVIICDECQFLSNEQVDQMRMIVDRYNIPVICFGLRSDFQTKLFPGSKRLFEIADSISEIKSICKCGNKAIINARFDGNGKIIKEGSQVDIGGNEKYVGMCSSCYHKLLGED